MNIDALSIRSQPPPQNIVPLGHSGDISLNTLLRDTGRTKNNTPGGRYNDDNGFNSINATLEQVGDRSSSSEMESLLRSSLGYANRDSSETFLTGFDQKVANLFGRPLVAIGYDADNNKVRTLSFEIPTIDTGLFIELFTNEGSLSRSFVELLRDCRGWPQGKIDSLDRWLKDNLPADTLNFSEATLYDIVLRLLQYPRTMAFAEDCRLHSDAAPHRDLPWENNVLEFLRRAAALRRE
ncbi:MAG: hypothetical protein LBJ75_01595 [Puniceicoccales bacterium]|jgi:hypothetical protein|nr:hypothetical protein [Puniceicoccales bacterium]